MFLTESRLDQNRAAAQLAAKLDQPISAIKKVTIWGNHSSTQFPDASQATCNGSAVSLDQAWLETEFVPTVQKRGAAVIAARKLSSAMSAAKVMIKFLCEIFLQIEMICPFVKDSKSVNFYAAESRECDTSSMKHLFFFLGRI